MDVVVTIVEYKNQLKARGYAPASMECYGRGLDLFSHYLQAQGIDDLRKVTKQTIFDYQSKIMEETIAQESKALKIRPHYAKKNPKERRLFLSNSGLSLTHGALHALIRTYRLIAGIKKPVSPHTFRRSCASHLMQQGADVRYIQKLLGHASLKTTQVYTKVMPVDVKKTHDQTHPNLGAI